MAVLHTHDICNYDFRDDNVVIELASKIKKMTVDNNILLTIHCDQFHVIATDREQVLQNTIKGLEYHCDLMDMLGIKYNCIHLGSKKGGIEAGKERFVNNFLRLPKRIQKSLMIENDDKSYNVEDILEICELLDIPMCYDFHHSRILPSPHNDSYYIDRIISTWANNEPIGHISSSADEDRIISKHHDYISLNDYNNVVSITRGKINLELECKQKDIALLNLLDNI